MAQLSLQELESIVSNPAFSLQAKNTARALIEKLTKPATSYDPSLLALIKLWADKRAYYQQIVESNGRGNVTSEMAQTIVTRLTELLLAQSGGN
jgi:hypothetical protein